MRDIQPIFARHCYECHGAEKQKGKLRLDERSSAHLVGKDAIIVSGKASQSELYRRVTLPKGDDDIMPNRGEPLSKAETDLIQEWINQGAIWPEKTAVAKHWSYVKPARSKIPEATNRGWARNEIDRFILARLEKEKLQPSPEANRSRLLRRVYFDLIGLPPSPQELENFLADTRPDAYEKVVDRLLASPQYGVRWARPWLDLARYADSCGYQRDNLWQIWPYRDWVINALNQDMPFDQFTIEQIGGDLLPSATLDQKIATGFNRCAAINVEAGSDQEESRVNQVFDRVNTLGTVWLGSTIECAQCHNHKYDPFTQKEYYQLFAFFNNTPKESKYSSPTTTIGLDFVGPNLTLPDKEMEEQRVAIQENIKKLDAQFEAASEKLLVGEKAWEDKLSRKLGTMTQTHVLEMAKFDSEAGSAHEMLGDKSVLLRKDDNDAVPDLDIYTITVHTELTNITGFKLETLSDAALPGQGPGRGDDKRPNFILTDFKVTATAESETKGRPIKFSKARASFEQKNFAVAKAIDGDAKTGWGITPQFSKDHWAVFETVTPLGSEQGTTFVFTLAQNYGGSRLIGRVRLSALTGGGESNDIPSEVVAALQIASTSRSDAQRELMSDFFLKHQPELEKIKIARNKLNRELTDLQPPQTLTMQEMDQPRISSTFIRGNFLEKGEPVQPDVPAVLPPLVSEIPRNRLALAQWLVSTNNPLVARVTVNRWWAEFFGHGIVTTPEDFGIKGDLPTHPELLDWLACEFMERGWSMKHIHRLIVTSAAYRQSSTVSPQSLERDDQNKLYARGPRFRMDAEMIRDNALAVAGLLSLKIDGAPVYPFQPPGLWESKLGGNPVSYEVSEGEDRYRRGIYTVLKRTSPYPSFISFDAPNRNACVVRRTRSNTPLQALTLLNDPVYVEAAQALAKRVVEEKPNASLEEKMRHAFEICLSRPPTGGEMKTLTRLYEEQLQSSRKDVATAEKLLRDFAKPKGIEAAEFAAWFSVASALLNLDETITKG
ncbi:MAG: PSD1 and planctomycete cytochrome C domain-containing protein [Verrucomicrobiota bacterium]